MADAVQLASALTSLIGATLIAVDYLKKLHGIQTYARDLYSKVNELRNILESIRPVVERLESSVNRRVMTDQARRLHDGIKGCFEKCQQAIDRINDKLRGFADADNVPLIQRFRILFAEKDIKLHSTAIEGHIQSLQLSLIALHALNDDVQHETTQQLVGELREFFSYFLVLLTNYPQHQASMGVRTQIAAVEPSQFLGSDRPMQALPSIDEPHEELELPFNRDVWSPRRTPSLPQPELAPGPSRAAMRESYVEEVYESEPETENIIEDAVIDSPLSIAVKRNQPAVLEALISRHQDLTITDAEGWTLLHHAVFEKSFEALSVLLESDQGRTQAFKDAQNFQQQTALMLCARKAESRSSLKLAKILIDHGVDINAEDGNGRTALHLLVTFVATSTREAFAELLVSNGAQFGSSCRRVPRRARDYDAVRDLAQQFRRNSSVATIPEALVASSPDSPSTSTAEISQRPRIFSFSSLRRRLSGDPNSIGPST